MNYDIMKIPRFIRIVFRIVFYLLMIYAAYKVVMADMHFFAQLALILFIATACIAVREWPRAVEIDPEIPMSPEEEIMYREMQKEMEEEEIEKPEYEKQIHYDRKS